MAPLAQASARGSDDDVLGRAHGVDDGDAGRRARDEAGRRRNRDRGARRRRDDPSACNAADRLRDRAAAESALHAGHERVDLRRRLDQQHVLACAEEGDAQRRGRLPLPPALPRQGLPDLVRRLRSRLGRRDDRGRRHHARGRGRRPRRPGRAHHRPRRQHPRQEPLRGRRRAARDRRPDAERPGGDAPRHGLHLLRPQRRHDLRARGDADPAGPVPARRRGGSHGRDLGPVVPRRGQGCARDRGFAGAHDRR